jgi:alpha-ketoglutarate-dependent 2,4-dichlorophenoxyacetate dioxygenase
MVRVHPATGRKALYIGRHASHIIGWPVDESRAYLDDLLARATVPKNCYTHQWRVGDLVMWDNRCVLHRGRPYDIKYRRVMHRTTIADPAPGNPWAL